jgi:alpha-tubulin suppressor-like RCC1 family protein
MADRVVTNFIDDDGLDVGCHLVSKEYVLENYPGLVPWMKAPALWTWGRGTSGELGNNSILNRSSPVQTVSGGTNWKQVSAKGTYGGGIKTDGTLWMWGAGFYGILGNNSVTDRSSPVQTVSNVTTWKSICVNSSNAAIKTDGTLWTWGINTYGTLGNNNITSRSSPVQTVSNVNTWKQASADGPHMAAIKTDGSLWTWGYAEEGRLGNNSTIARSSPVQTVSNVTTWKQVSTGYRHKAAVKIDGTLWTWGVGASGQLGNNDTTSRSSPVQTVSNVNTWKQVSTGTATTGAIKTDGTLWLWGNATAVGGARSSPIQTVSGGTNWLKVSVEDITAGIKTDGTLWVWGQTNYGGLGTNNDYSGGSSPVQTVSGGNGWRDVTTSGSMMIALRDEGEF